MGTTMETAQLIELKAMDHQKDMNAVIDRGDSPVQQFYYGATVFVTGGSGFLGKPLVEKLLRSCNIKKLYLLLRPKKGKTIQERLDYVLKDPLFDGLREKNQNFAEKIVPVTGDVAHLKLGISKNEWSMVTQDVDTMFHMAATIRFDEALHVATMINVRGTMECVALAKECRNLKNFVYVGTAFSHATVERVGKPVLEQFYQSPLSPDVMIGLAESLDVARLNDITNDLIQGWPNTYTFTKAIAEEVIRTSASELPVCIIRPPIVVPSYYEPKPGWMDTTALSGPTGILAGVIMGILHVFLVDRHSKLPLSPVDYVNNATIAAGWDAAEKRRDGEKEIQIYTVSNKDYFTTWGFIGNTYREEGLPLASPKALWYCYVIEVSNKFSYGFLTFFLHYIPAFVMDTLGKLLGTMPKDISSYVGVFRKIDKFALIYRYFLVNEWGFQDDNVQAMMTRMSTADKAIFNCDLKTINFNEYVKVWGLGIRRYIIKDGLKGSTKGGKKQMKFKILNYFLISLYVLIVSSILLQFWSFVKHYY